MASFIVFCLILLCRSRGLSLPLYSSENTLNSIRQQRLNNASARMITGQKNYSFNYSLPDGMHIHDIVPDDYDHLEWPQTKDGTALKVHTNLGVRSIQRVDQLTRTITFDLYLEMSWQDFRLNLPKDMSPDDVIPLPPSMEKKLWIPDPFINNLRDLSSAALVKPSKGMMCAGDYTITYSELGTAEVGCKMNFREYPVDTQICRIQLQSFDYDAKILQFLWRSNISTEASLSTEDYLIALVQLKEYNKTYHSYNFWNGHTFSMLEFRLILQRLYFYHVLDAYLPSTLLVACAWLTFLIPRHVVPGRMALCVTTVLTMTGMVAASKHLTPHSQYIKAIEIWMLVCLCFIFYALFAFIFALKLGTMDKTLKKHRHLPWNFTQSYLVSPIVNGKPQAPRDETPQKNLNYWKETADWFEFASFCLYLVAFVCFGVWYWNRLSKGEDDYKFFVPSTTAPPFLSDDSVSL